MIEEVFMFLFNPNSLRTKIENNEHKREIYVAFLSIFVGIGSGLGGVLFRYSIEWVAKSFSFIFNLLPFLPKELNTILSPAIGGVIVAIIIILGGKDSKGHGVPEVIDSVNNKNGVMKYRVPLVKMIASAVTLGSGGSAGSEGPIVQIGGGIGSIISQTLKLRPEESKILVIAGAGSGLAAIFSAPLGGSLFGIEIIRRDKKVFSIFPVLLASVVSTTISELFLGAHPPFPVPTVNQLPLSVLLNNVPLFIGLGLLIGIYSVIWIRGFDYIEDFFDGIKMNPILLAGIGGLLVGIIELIAPQISGAQEYVPVQDAIIGKFGLQLMVILLFAKLIGTSITIGSGGSGGIFSPTMFQGVMIGGAYYVLLGLFNLLGFLNIQKEVYPILGMAGMIGASTRAPLTAIIMTSEMVKNFFLFIPLTLTVVTSWAVSSALENNDMYIYKLRKSGHFFATPFDLLEDIQVKDIMSTDLISVHPKDRLEHVLTLMKESNHTGFPVIADKDILVGIITEHDVSKALDTQNLKSWTVGQVCTKEVVTVVQNCPTSVAFQLMVKEQINRLPVVESIDEKKKIVGWLTRSDIMRAYLVSKKIKRLTDHEKELFDKFSISDSSAFND